ncbi:bifunctional diaminohydroxyphosphoribosylaminopyrimidine deaminase/5-amino-6-(5-phosphoribosylamino)uracil reductase RibD [Vibrio cholerae]|uniref:bifunctional diaminohydroxyphosphoribosylaminopyrimidine deaminase/5-amino-6-(5-phosphoribosylamino)uracil reductase RibD n=1 Tax=Vibrio cholerae TaxID=666 RepID=UPI00293438E1|nr:bifunctional diaminohydroxyphosphoribosylaminopyrimidine deaminase/5-amino-6-(5-phosphoribosylamino)uracil reductase RibD [Vibrio cholerae]MDV2348722.1 bifunctional diaminohydroxyphosphoribosylaminopyrimidine deaminase/5-amino-6-(5-phosphoribosylamino)uracil reductase RibD [Vibrio cholerae]HDI3247071.1 bifunctional diaminohydroxyphosphoribosylaminopyrimidine deaminase/5-amino-6-(5-phosphoribosylamino)uracil reductase RibD [Vibrio cholerae]
MPMFTSFDHQMMSRAIELAWRGRFTTSPNPNVGCVITRGEQIVGEGFHFRAGEPHAEVHAMRQAGELTRGATAYVTLEPCSHYGRTPPCAEGLIKAGVAKVICAMQDPNPQVAGKGVQMLRDAGIEVEVGLLEADARALNRGFLKRMETGMPYVQLKMAASLDGQTALANGKSQWITSPAARKDVQRFRAQASAILSTSQTVLADNASLAVRWHDLPLSVQAQYAEADLRQPLRVILDRQHQLHPELALYQTPSPVLRVASENAELCISAEHGKLDLRELLALLAQQHNVHQVWVEAGSQLAQSLIEQKLVDEIILYLAPKLMGSDGRGLFGALGLTEMAEAIELKIEDCRMVGADLRIIATPKTKD